MPRRVAFFVWVATHGRILAADNLMKWGFVMANWCTLCKASGETVEHLLLHCPFVVALWSFFLNLAGICWVMLCLVDALLGSWGQFG